MPPFLRFIAALLIAALVAILVAFGFVVALILIPILVVLVLALRWHVRRQAARFGHRSTIIEGVAFDVTVEPSPDDDRPSIAPPRATPET